MDHPVSEHNLKRFAEGASSRAESRSVVSHLLKGCSDCAGQLRLFLRPEVPAEAYDGVFDRLNSDRLQRLQQGARLLPFHKPRVHAPRLERRSQARH
jgi:hypothetical protein